MREKEGRLLPAADMWTSGAEMLPVLLEELKSASLPAKQRGRSVRDGSRGHAGQPLPPEALAPRDGARTQQVASFQGPGSLACFPRRRQGKGQIRGLHFVNAA